MADSEETRAVASGGGDDGGGGPTVHTGGGDDGGGGPTVHTGGGDDGGGGPTVHTGGVRLTIVINNKEYNVDKPSLTGAELKALAGEPPDRVVVRIGGTSDAEQGGDDGETIQDNQSVNLASGMQFRVINAATFGRGS